MHKIIDVLFGLITAIILIIVKDVQKLIPNLTFFDIYILPIILAVIVYSILYMTRSKIESYLRPLRKYEGYWIELIKEPAYASHAKYISILELNYSNNYYTIRGTTFLSNGTSIATWRADRTHFYDKEHKLLDYIYTSDIKTTDFIDTTVRGYANIDFKSKEGYILDITNINNKKQHFILEKQIKKESDITNLSFNKKVTTELIKFYKS